MNKNQSIQVHPTRNDKDKVEKVSYTSLYRYAGTKEKIYVIIGMLGSICAGIIGPMRGIFKGEALDSFADKDDAMHSIKKPVLNMVYFGIGMMAATGIMEFAWSIAGERLGILVRTLYLKAIMKKDVSWFDINRPQELPTKISNLISKYQSGIGDKLGNVVMTMTMFVAGLIIAFIYGWKLAFIFLALAPLTIFAKYLISISNSRGAAKSKRAYEKCGGYADEALSAIRTVYAFCCEEYEKRRYLAELDNAQKTMLTNSIFQGIGTGIVNFTTAFSHGLGYFVGSFYIEHQIHNDHYDKPYNCGAVMIVLISALLAMTSLGLIGPQLRFIDEARMAAYDIYKLIDSINNSKGNKNDGKAQIPSDEFKGRIEFKNVTFCYPTRPDIKILNNFSMTFEPGKVVGLCGETGSGKSTIIQLIERFYTPDSGIITVDGIDLNTLDIKWWRSKIGYVCQEPVLFNVSIRANIEYGKENATQEEIESAAISANAAEFIKRLKDGYNTNTGNDGNQLSGGQKQRIAIARGLLRKPKILLLDEATSALDNDSERKVQESFRKLQSEEGMTMIVVAHRLTTIKNSDEIIVMQNGELKELGNDSELREKNGIYANLCRIQGAEAEIADLKKSTTEDTEEAIIRKKTEVALQKKETEEKLKTDLNGNVKEYKSQLWSESWKYRKTLIMAIGFSIISGIYMPIIGLLVGLASMDLQDEDDIRSKINLDFIGFVIDAVVVFGACIGMFGLFGYVASQVARTMREKIYHKIFTMDIGWFDMPENIPSNLNTVLSEETEKINGVVRLLAGIAIQCIASVAIGLVISFVYSWKMSLIIVVCLPLMTFRSGIQVWFHMKFAKVTDELYKDPAKILAEAVKNFRTVSSFSGQKRVLKMYSDALAKPLANSFRSAIIAGILFGVGQLIRFLVYAGLIYFAAWFMVHQNDDPKGSVVSIYTLLFAVVGVGQLQQYSPDFGKAYKSLQSIYKILEETPKIVSPANAAPNQISGKIVFKNVSFKYPTREDYALKNLTLTIEAGQKAAIVGISGSGKSTITQLLERFYDAESGEILIDGVNIKDYNINDLRKAIGYVPQEPVLFDTTIAENVKYGTNATISEIEGACTIADAMDFISKDQSKHCVDKRISTNDEIDIGTGLNRKVGARGSLLSGGQKQRLAIARAILRNPKIMIFDEATSALDSETEKLVQNALNRVSEGRTSITIAHRLGTLEESDIIYVIENGKLAETGTKKELEAKKGSFYKLYKGN